MTNNNDILLALYLDDIAYARHHENLRSAITNLILVVGAALGGLIGFDQTIDTSDIPAAIFLVVVGISGAIFCYKHFERFHSHYARARELRSKLDLATGLEIIKLKELADKKHRKQFPKSYRLSVGWLWTAFPLTVSIFGFLVLVVALCGK